jgi:hypothetical protein
MDLGLPYTRYKETQTRNSTLLKKASFELSTRVFRCLLHIKKLDKWWAYSVRQHSEWSPVRFKVFTHYFL